MQISQSMFINNKLNIKIISCINLFTSNEYYLATITSVEESNFVKSTFPNKTFWIGGADFKGQGNSN